MDTLREIYRLLDKNYEVVIELQKDYWVVKIVPNDSDKCVYKMVGKDLEVVLDKILSLIKNRLLPNNT